MTIERFEDLEIWQVARELCKFVYEITEREPFRKALKGTVLKSLFNF